MSKTTLLRALLAVAILLGGSSPALAESSSYTYDPLGRVLTQTDADGTTVTFSYDPAGNRTQRITSAGSAHRPTAANDNLTATGSTPASIDPRTNDTDPNGDTLSVTGASTPGHGTASFTSSSVTYTATSGYSGSDVFSYTVTDTHGLSSKAYVNVTVNAAVADGTVLFTSSTAGAWSYTIAAGVNAIDVEVWGGGGGGGSWHRACRGTCYAGIGGPGGGGGYAKKHVVAPSGTLTGSVAAGGAGGPIGDSNPGSPGGATTVTSPVVTASGGGGNATSDPNGVPIPGAGGSASGGDTNITGDTGIFVLSPRSSTGGGAGNGGGDGNATTPGGGGDGASANTVPGVNGANGMVKITARSS